LLLHRTAYTFCFLMPFGFANTLGWATPFVTALAAYTLFGLDALGNELEEPFAPIANALPINALTDLIEIELREALGDEVLPASPMPKEFVLM
jgi:ion channel-forming bestrophin family protein